MSIFCLNKFLLSRKGSIKVAFCCASKILKPKNVDATVVVNSRRFKFMDSKESDHKQQQNIDFENHVEAFKGKTTWEIMRALFVLKICSVNVFVDNSLTIMNCVKRILGVWGLRILFKPIFYKQFVGGENTREIQKCLRKLHETGIRPMLAATMEEDIGEEGAGKEEIYNSNCSRIIKCIQIATMENTPEPMMQLKMTGLLSADLVVALSQIYSICTCDEKVQLVKEIAEGLVSNNVMVFQHRLTNEHVPLLNAALGRLTKISNEAQSKSVKILVDAEYTYMNPGLSLLTLAMASVYNKHSPLIWNTYQCYLKDAHNKLSEELHITEELNIYFGAKLVRGAYVCQERTRAKTQHLEDPICADYETTNVSYNKALTILFDRIEQKSKCTFIVASHNEESVLLSLQKIEEMGIDKIKGGISFGQLYGMCDQITYPLAVSGYAVYKSIPYGSLEEVLPYLSRRTTENRSVLEGTRKEQSLLLKEIKYRMSCSRST